MPFVVLGWGCGGVGDVAFDGYLWPCPARRVGRGLLLRLDTPVAGGADVAGGQPPEGQISGDPGPQTSSSADAAPQRPPIDPLGRSGRQGPEGPVDDESAAGASGAAGGDLLHISQVTSSKLELWWEQVACGQ